MQPSGIGPALIRGLPSVTAPDLAELFVPGRVLDAEVVSVFGEHAILSFGRGMRLEVALQASLAEGQRIRVQVQPREEARDAVVMKLMATAETALREGANLPTQGTAPHAPQPQPGAPQLFWLPIPLADGRQGWAQLQVQEEAARPRGRTGVPAQQVRLYWETPSLGPVQVVMDSSSKRLTAVFTVPDGDARQQIEGALDTLQTRFAAVGFPESQVGCRQPVPGETVEPVRAEAGTRLDQRM